MPPSPKRVVLSFLDPQEPFLKLYSSGGVTSAIATNKDSNMTIIYVNRDKDFDAQGKLKEPLQEKFLPLKGATKIDVHGHGAAGSDTLSSDWWAYPIFSSPRLSWIRSPFPRTFDSNALVSILSHCESNPTVEIVACESAKATKEGPSFCERLAKKVSFSNETLDQPSAASDQPSVASDQPSVAFDKPRVAFDKPRVASDKPRVASDQPSAVSNKPSVASIRGHTESIALTGFDPGSQKYNVYVPVTGIEKLISKVAAYSFVIPFVGPLLVGILGGILKGAESIFRGIFSPKFCKSNEDIEKKRNIIAEACCVECVTEEGSFKPVESRKDVGVKAPAVDNDRNKNPSIVQTTIPENEWIDSRHVSRPTSSPSLSSGPSLGAMKAVMSNLRNDNTDKTPTSDSTENNHVEPTSCRR